MRRTLEKLGEYVPPQATSADQLGSVKLDPFVFTNQSIYVGEWRNGARHGVGKQYWQDGSYYYGYWKNNMVRFK